jgi:hypothetical protein
MVYTADKEEIDNLRGYVRALDEMISLEKMLENNGTFEQAINKNPAKGS